MDEHTPLGMIGAALAELRAALGLDSALVIDSTDSGRAPQPLYVVGLYPSSMLARVGDMLRASPASMSRFETEDGRRIVVCPWTLPPNRAGGLVLLRGPDTPRWTSAELSQAAIAAPLLRVMLEFGPDEMGIDRLTGLPNRMYFLDEADRHIERLAQDRLSGTLMIVELDGLDQFTVTHGQPARDWTLARIGALIRAMVRPADLVGRVGAAAFAVWLNGADHMTAAERAEVLCGRRLTLPEAPGRSVIPLPSLSVGIASRVPDSEEDARGLLLRARDAAAVARRDGGGWHVARGRG